MEFSSLPCRCKCKCKCKKKKKHVRTAQFGIMPVRSQAHSAEWPASQCHNRNRNPEIDWIGPAPALPRQGQGCTISQCYLRVCHGSMRGQCHSEKWVQVETKSATYAAMHPQKHMPHRQGPLGEHARTCIIAPKSSRSTDLMPRERTTGRAGHIIVQLPSPNLRPPKHQ